MVRGVGIILQMLRSYEEIRMNSIQNRLVLPDDIIFFPFFSIFLLIYITNHSPSIQIQIIASRKDKTPHHAKTKHRFWSIHLVSLKEKFIKFLETHPKPVQSNKIVFFFILLFIYWIVYWLVEVLFFILLNLLGIDV